MADREGGPSGAVLTASLPKRDREWVERISHSRRAYVILAILIARSLRIDSSQGGVSVEGEE